jgi:hypothetical protein
VGIRKTRGIADRSITPQQGKAILNPFVGVELKCRISVVNEIPKATPRDRNIPRRPVIVEILSGMSSMQALLEAGREIPIPIPVIMTRIAKIAAAPKLISTILSSRNPEPPREIIESDMMLRPKIIGDR